MFLRSWAVSCGCAFMSSRFLRDVGLVVTNFAVIPMNVVPILLDGIDDVTEVSRTAAARARARTSRAAARARSRNRPQFRRASAGRATPELPPLLPPPLLVPCACAKSHQHGDE